MKEIILKALLKDSYFIWKKMALVKLAETEICLGNADQKFLRAKRNPKKKKNTMVWNYCYLEFKKCVF